MVLLLWSTDGSVRELIWIFDVLYVLETFIYNYKRKCEFVCVCRRHVEGHVRGLELPKLKQGVS